VTKFALPALTLIIFGLFYFSVTSQPPDTPSDIAGQREEVTQQPAVTVAAKTEPDRVQQLARTVDNVSAELKRLSDETKTNSDKIAQAAALRSDLQDSKSSNDRTAQSLAQQVDALRSDQVKFLQETKDSNDKAAQALRQEFAASQARLVAEVGDTLKANTARSEALAQRVDAMKKEIDDVRKNIEEDRQNVSNISPGLALVVALAALALGPFLTRQLTLNQLAAARKEAEAKAAATQRSQAARTTQAEPPLAPSAAAELPHHDSPQHEAPPLGEDVRPQHEVDPPRKAAPDSEKV
jgi:uncharacterized phage infection (PIP) family protein YhgE